MIEIAIVTEDDTVTVNKGKCRQSRLLFMRIGRPYGATASVVGFASSFGWSAIYRFDLKRWRTSGTNMCLNTTMGSIKYRRHKRTGSETNRASPYNPSGPSHAGGLYACPVI